MKKENSFGIIPVIKKSDKWFVFLIQNKFSDHWGFPKGRANENETHFESAKRELKEETNLLVNYLIQDTPLKEQYICIKNNEKINKTVLYYLCKITNEDYILQEEEVINGGFFIINRAKDILTYKQSKALMNDVINTLKDIK